MEKTGKTLAPQQPAAHHVQQITDVCGDTSDIFGRWRAPVVRESVSFIPCSVAGSLLSLCPYMLPVAQLHHCCAVTESVSQRE